MSETESTTTMRLLAFAASTSTQSINRKLIDYATRLLDDGLVPDIEIETIDLNDYEMPIFSTDRHNESGTPQAAQDFFDAIGRADAVLISFAEHNGSYTVAYKNILDWASRIDMRVYQDKPAVLFAASVGPGGAVSVLNAATQFEKYLGYDVKASLSIPRFNDNFDTDTGSLSDDELDARFRAALVALADNAGAVE